jgi:hypothetical protein
MSCRSSTSTRPDAAPSFDVGIRHLAASLCDSPSVNALRGSSMRIGMAVLIALVGSMGAWADAPANPAAAADSGARWDDSHMQSRHRDTPRTSRPRLEGESGYGALASGGAASSKQIMEELEFTSQREWAQGPLSTGSDAKAKAAASAAGDSRSSGIQRGSQLRAGAVHSGRRGR